MRHRYLIQYTWKGEFWDFTSCIPFLNAEDAVQQCKDYLKRDVNIICTFRIRLNIKNDTLLKFFTKL